MTVYEIIQKKEQQVDRLTREIAALRAAARMLEESQSAELEPAGSLSEVATGDARMSERKSLRQFP
jgi:hypothetical protein